MSLRLLKWINFWLNAIPNLVIFDIKRRKNWSRGFGSCGYGAEEREIKKTRLPSRDNSILGLGEEMVTMLRVVLLVRH